MLSESERESLSSIPTCDGLDGRDLIKALVIFVVFVLIFIPKIYLSSEIYYLSRDLAKIKNRLELLKEENQALKKSLEDFKFQQVLRMD